MKLILTTLAAMALSTAASNAALWTLSGSMDVLQAGTNGGFGAGTGNGSGSIMGTYDDVTNFIAYSITFQDLSATASALHFHTGAPGVSGGVALAITDLTSPSTGTGTVSAGGETDLLAGNWYVNVHTSTFGGGEIRGQVNVAPVPEPSVSLLAIGGVAAMFLRRKRK